MLSPRLKTGPTKIQLKSLENRLKKADQKLEALRTSKQQGFMDLPYDFKTVRLIEKEAERIKRNFDNLIVIGIGGSDLGTRAINRALVPLNQYDISCKNGKPIPKKNKGVRLYFAGGNTDPCTLNELLEELDLKRTAINIVSKSGSTIEPMSAFLIIREALIKNVGKKAHTEHIVATTDLAGGALYKIAKNEGYRVLPHPPNVGGRFAVLSTVGLFPAACAGIPVKKMLAGARSIENERREKGYKSSAAQFAALHYLGYKKGRKIHILMPYSDALREFALWYRQLWAESLGKKKGRQSIGPTPIAALGATDQHSQLQLYNEGPADKIVTFIRVGRFRSDVKVPKAFRQIDQIKYFQGKLLSQILDAEYKGTAEALTKHQTANGTINLTKISSESLGALFMFYELACAYLGELFGIDTYNQPGVELGKKETKRILSGK